MSRALDTVHDVARWRLCQGCGACAYACPEGNLVLVDEPAEGIRPRVSDPGRCESCQACLEVCPGYELDYADHRDRPGADAALAPLFGPVLEIWEGHAADPEIRFAGSSGGALTALALYCLEHEGAHGVLHIGADAEDPVRNRTRLSRSRAELLERTGSRYAPASACDRLGLIEDAPAPCVFIGQPSEAAALDKARRVRPRLDARVGLVLSFFCAGSPSSQGTVDLLRKLGIERSRLASLRYRGQGWPGLFTAAASDGRQKQLTYQESWGFLQKYRPYGAHLWPDDTGEAADVSCGDPWYEAPKPGDAGSSLVVVRTETGRRIVRAAREAGYLELAPAEGWKLAKSQENLSRKRRAVAGRRLAFRLFGLPVTRLKGFPLLRNWLGLPGGEKFRSVFGTLRRIAQRRYYRPTRPARPPTEVERVALDALGIPQAHSRHQGRPNASRATRSTFRSGASRATRSTLGGLLVRRPTWKLTLRGKFFVLIALAGLGWAGLRGLYPFLAVTDRVPADILVVDGWLPTDTLAQAAAESGRGYGRVLAVRGVTTYDSVDLDRPLDDYVADILVRHGVARGRLSSVLFPGFQKDRTYSSALAVKAWLERRGLHPAALDLATLGAHARRSRLLYEKAFGPGVRIGVVALDDPAFDGRRWWKSSEGVREVLFEGVAYLYVRLVFIPFPAVSAGNEPKLT